MANDSYITSDELVTFLSLFYPGDMSAYVSDELLYQSYDQIKARLRGHEWKVINTDDDGVVKVNGNGEKFIYLPYTPINTLDSITIKDWDESEDTPDLSGSDRDVWWDTTTGRIEMRHDYWFKEGMQNIEFEGNFGEEPPELAKYLQMLLCLKLLSLMNGKLFSTDMIREKIGKYEYQKGVPSSQDTPNQYKGLDGYIEYLFSILDNLVGIDVETI